MFSLSLMHLARGILEAASKSSDFLKVKLLKKTGCAAWATVIHQSCIPDAVAHEAGVRLKDLAAHSNMSLWAAL